MLALIYNELRKRGDVRTQTEFGERLGWGRAYTSQIISGNRQPPQDIAQRMAEVFPNIELANILPKAHQNAREIGEPSAEYTSNKNNHFQKLGDHKYLMFTKLVNKRAAAGYLAGWGDDEYIETLPTHAIIVDEQHKGTYRSFEISGDSADDDSKRSISDGDIVTGRLVNRGFWKSRLHNHKYPYWIIVHRVEGILCKMITEHDTEQGTILCVSRNPDKKKYPDLLLSLDDVSEIYNVVQVTVNGKNL